MIAPHAALADGRSAFRVADAKLADSRLRITLAFDHPGGSCRAEFFAHRRVPQHVAGRVHAGLPLGETMMAAGKGVCTLAVDLRRLEQAGFEPGDRLYVAADWPNNRHLWGTTGDGRPGHHAGTSFVIPDPDRPGAHASRPRRAVHAPRPPRLPGVPKAPKAPSLAELLTR